MSGYPGRGYRGGSGAHYRGSNMRDIRERSPDRRDDRRYRDDRPRQDDRQYENRRGRCDSGQNQRGRGGGYTQHVQDEGLPSLPSEVAVPKSGGRLTLDVPLPKGKLGRPTNLLVNHFMIQSLPTIKIYQYDIRMSVPPESQRRGSEKVSAMQQAKVLPKTQKFWGSRFIYDGVSLGWSVDCLMDVDQTLSTMVDLDGHSTDRPNQVLVSMRNTGPINIRALVNWLKTNRSGLMSHRDTNVEDVLKFLNATYRQDPASRLITRPKSSAFFQRSPNLSLTLQSTGGVLEAMRGIHQAVQVSFGQLSLNIDVVCSAFYVPNLPIMDVVKAFAGVSPRQQLDSSMAMVASDRVNGIFINVRHLNEVRNARKMRITRLSTRGAKETTFEQMNHEAGTSTTTSVYEYFHKKYNITIKHPDLPLVVTKDGSFPMELCYTASGERYKEALQGQETADFIKWATSPAFVRNAQIIDNVKRLNWHNLEIPKAMGLSVSPKMLEIRGRILPCPLPIYKYGTDPRSPENGSWNLRNKTLYSPKGFKSWGVLYLPGGRPVDRSTLDGFCRSLSNMLATMGMGIPQGPPSLLTGNPQGDMKEIIHNLYSKTGNEFKRKPDIVFILCHAGAPPHLYRAIKSVCEVDLGCASQVMLVEKALKGGPQYIGNIGLKVNLKLGGANSVVNMPPLKEKLFMMLGGDSSHPSPGELRRIPPPPSYTGLVASYDPQCVRYTAVATAQHATDELIGTFKPMMKELMKRWQLKNNGKSPQCVIYWRDGIAESQVPAFMASEVQALKEVCKETQEGIKVTVVNCVKRHHTRLFPAQGERGDKLGNVSPGTVVEASGDQDIFLVSQAALQGTVRPCRYTILLDENRLSPDQFQMITNGLCFSYGKATRSVSIVAPVFYADQVCERSRLHTRTEDDKTVAHDVHANLQYTMYWQ